MGKIYENKVTDLGNQVEAFMDEGMFILFGENAPATLKDFCYMISVNPVEGELAAGQKLIIDEVSYEITAVGSQAQKNLETLGHLTIVFNEASEAGLPGSICVEAKPVPTLVVGSEIIIEE
ncbi:MAG: PTS glucitol/sorbitol transporter subunit IIA [Lachnospiraceae bacterium]|nr:PTS glucitol/sorbitol transporter subunit IIA [Lachnospiraceae bacterium]